MSLQSLKLSNNSKEKKSTMSGSCETKGTIGSSSSKLLRKSSQEVNYINNLDKNINLNLSEDISFNNNGTPSLDKRQDKIISTLGEGQGTRSILNCDASLTNSNNSVSSRYVIPKCIPPWAKSMRKKYGLSTSDLNEDYTSEKRRTNMEEQIKKHKKKQLMLVKEKNCKTKLILERSESSSDMEGVIIGATNTRYYTPLLNRDSTKLTAGDHKRVSLALDEESMNDNSNYNSLQLIHEPCKPQMQKELFNVPKTTKYCAPEREKRIHIKEYIPEKEDTKCPKITLNNIREYVKNQTMNQDEKKLHDIIRIENVPMGSLENRRKMGTKYIINVPQCKDPEMANVIRVKEKHKLQRHSLENIDKHIKCMKHDHTLIKEVKNDTTDFVNVLENIKTLKSPTETRTLEVKTKRTPKIQPLFDTNKDVDKLLLIQFEQKSKPKKNQDETANIITTQLLGVKESHTEDFNREMYLYGTHTDGTTVKENVTKVNDVSPRLKDRVNLLFEELRELTYQKPIEPERSLEENELVSRKETVDHPSRQQITTDVATVQATPDVKSAEVQVRESMILNRERSSTSTLQSHPIASSETLSITDKQLLEDSDLSSETKGLDTDIGAHPQTEQPIKEESLVHIEKMDITEESISIDEEKHHNAEAGQEVLDKSKPSVGKSIHKELSEIQHESKYSGISTVTLQSVVVAGSKNVLPGSTSEIMTSKNEVTPLQVEFIPSKTEDDLKSQITSSKLETVTPLEKEFIPSKTEDDLKSEITPSKLEITSKTEVLDTNSGKDSLKTELSSLKTNMSSLKYVDVLSSKSEVVSRKPSDVKESRKEVDEDKQPPEAKMISYSHKKFNSDDNIKDKYFLSHEDIESYELLAEQEYDSKPTFLTKFLHGKESLKKKMDWTDSAIYLEKQTCPLLVQALAQTAIQQPADPISFLAHFIYKDYHNREFEEQDEVWKEHLDLAQTMDGLKRDQLNGPVLKKFNLKRYPIVMDSAVLNDEEKNLTVEEDLEQNVSVQ